MSFEPLSKYVQYVTEKASISKIDVSSYISTENMLQDKGGVQTAQQLPRTSNVNAFKKSDTLFSNIRTYFKKIWFAQFDGGASPDVLILRTRNKSVLNSNFLYYLLCDECFINHTTATSIGVKMPRGDKDAIMQYKVNIPTIPVQKKIAKILSALDDKIAKNNEINQTLEAMAQALFKSWFVDFDPVKAKMTARANGGDDEAVRHAAMTVISGKSAEELVAFPAANPEAYTELAATADLFPESMIDSELGPIPQGWEVKKVEELLDRHKVKQKFTNKNILQDGDIPVFDQSSNLILGYSDCEGDFKSSINNPFFIFGDHTCTTHLYTKPFSVGPNVIPLSSKSHDSYWTYFAIKDLQKFQEYRRHWMEFIVKTTVTPSTEIAKCFGDRVKQSYILIEANIINSKSLATIRNTLLPKLLSGEIDLSSFDSTEVEA